MKPKTDERVWFTDTRNCLELDPERALDEMWRTAEDQAYLKMQAGVKRGGRVCEDPVKTLSLSWHKDDTPTPEHMIESADAFLKHMGWDAASGGAMSATTTPSTATSTSSSTASTRTPAARSTITASRSARRNGRCLREGARTGPLRAARDQCRQARATGAEEHQGRARQRPPSDRSAPSAVAAEPANDHLPHNVIMLARPHGEAVRCATSRRASSSDRLERDAAEGRAARRARSLLQGRRQAVQGDAPRRL